MMKEILIIASDMEIGGAERALLGLLDTIDAAEYHVDLFLLRHQGPFMDLLPDKVNLIPEKKYYSDLGVPIGTVIKRGHFHMTFARGIGKWKAKQYVKKRNLSSTNSVAIHYSFLYTKLFLPQISNKIYDLAIGFTVPYYLVAEKVNAKHKVGWVHTDYSHIDGDTEEELKVWDAYEKIISISQDVTAAFISKYPELESKVMKIENIIPSNLIIRQADEFDVSDEMMVETGTKKLLSIGRFCYAKNFDNVPEICSRILQEGCKIKWFLIGFGNDEDLIRRRIKELHMEKNVCILGEKANPYPYIKECDFYIQPSRFEGKSVAVSEAQILHKPVIVTNFPTAHSQVNDGISGVIVPMDNAGCAEGIVRALRDEELKQRLIDNSFLEDFSNASEVQKLYSLCQ